MDLGKQSLFQMMKERMVFLGERQKVLSQNIANADTPGYQARDMRKMDFTEAVERSMHRVAPSITQVGHLPPVSAPTTFAVDKVKKPYETSPDKNGVVLEEQMMKVAEVQQDYTLNTTLYKKYTDMLKMALRG